MDPSSSLFMELDSTLAPPLLADVDADEPLSLWRDAAAATAAAMQQQGGMHADAQPTSAAYHANNLMHVPGGMLRGSSFGEARAATQQLGAMQPQHAAAGHGHSLGLGGSGVVPHGSVAHGMQMSHLPLPSQSPVAPMGSPSYPSSGPPAHLLADALSPFNQAVFEVDADLNGSNPSSFGAAGMGMGMGAGLHLSPPGVQRGATGDSLQFGLGGGAAGLSIGHMAPMQPQQPIVGHYDSLIDAQEELANTHAGRKRARGAAPSVYGSGPAATAAEVQHPRRELEESTFRVFVPPTRIVPDEAGEIESPSRSQHAMEHMRAQQAQAHASASANVAARPPSSVASVHSNSGGAGASSSAAGGSLSPHGLVDDKKKKHQETDRERRRRIKDSMDELKKLVPLAPDQKADQATIVGASVAMLHDLKDEVAELRKKLQQMEMTSASEQAKLESKRAHMQRATAAGTGTYSTHNLLSNAPFTSMMASLNGAGVSMWRLSLTGRLIEVNVVWELVSGFSAAEVVGQSPCGPPLFGSLSIMPAAFLKAFAQVSAMPKHNVVNGEALMLHSSDARYRRANSPNSGASSSSATPQDVHSPYTPGSATSNASHATARGSEGESAPGSPSGSSGASVSASGTASAAKDNVAPLYANASISNFPIVPQHQLQNFFPATVRCQTLIDAHDPDAPVGASQPQPHGTFLVNHLAALPPGHVLKLLCRHQTLWGEMLESIVTLCLVRDQNGQPDFVLMLSTPDTRRLLTPATHMHSRHSAALPSFDDTSFATTQPAF